MSKVPRFVFVDGLRGIAAMSVVLFHAVEGNHITALYAALPPPLALPLRYGNYGVAIFFVLSGFVIAHSLSSKNMTVGAAGRFMLKRSVRLDTTLLVRYIAGDRLQHLGRGYFDRQARRKIYVTSNCRACSSHLQDVLGYEEINPVFWTTLL